MSNGKELALRGQAFEIMPVESLKQQTEQLNELYKGLMQEGTDYGKVPGTDKPTLLKSGAELLRLRARLDPHFEIDSNGTDLNKGIFSYTVTCELFRDGEHIGAGVGSCNSLESKYRYRWVFESALPKGLDKETLPTKKVRVKGNWTPTYRIENENPQDLANTILKMAKKRAFVDAILTVTGASRIFTQDVEDLADSGVIENHKEILEEAKAEAEPEESEPTDLKTLEFKNPGEFYTACLNHFKLAKSRVDAEVPEYDLTNADQRQKAWEAILAIYGHKLEQ